jgi:hypothetical protein
MQSKEANTPQVDIMPNVQNIKKNLRDSSDQTMPTEITKINCIKCSMMTKAINSEISNNNQGKVLPS